MDPVENEDRLNILLVDDQPSKLLTYETILADLGENLLKAGSATEALEHLLRREVAIVLMDVSMPDVDGFELASIIRQHPRCEKTAIIFVSAVHLTDLDRLKGYETGAVDYLPVPVAPQVLRAKIRVLADLHRKSLQLKRLNGELERRVAERTEALEDFATRVHESESRFRTLAERMPHLVWEADARGRATFHNRRWYEYTGNPADSGLGESWQTFIHPDDRAQLLNEWRDAIDTAGAHPLDVEVRIRRWDGQYRWFRFTGAPSSIANHKVEKWVGTCTDIEERKRAEERLREADRRKDEFLAMLAHELRNPLAPIRNAVKLLRQADQPEAAQRWSRELIERQVEQLTRLVDDLLDVSRITRGKIRLQVEPLDLGTVVSGALETSRPMIDARRHEFTLVQPDERIYVAGDLVRLTQVIANLLNNAAKFQAEGGTIELIVERDGDDACVHVRDRGIGIAPEMLGEVFDLFAQVERTMDRSEGGLGIGLSLVKTLVEMHGGSVMARSAGRGKGSEFSIRLPRLPDDAAFAASEVEAGDAAPSGRSLSVLVVDDNRDAAESLALLLRLRGHHTATAHDGRKALQLALETNPDVVLLDLGLPGIDGFEVCRALREQSFPAYVVAVTGYGREADRRRSKSAGFDAHLVKPVDPDGLVRLLADAAASRGL
jgi:two-component system CheB/CheR fusion protein